MTETKLASNTPWESPASSFPHHPNPSASRGKRERLQGNMRVAERYLADATPHSRAPKNAVFLDVGTSAATVIVALSPANASAREVQRGGYYIPTSVAGTAGRRQGHCRRTQRATGHSAEELYCPW